MFTLFRIRLFPFYLRSLLWDLDFGPLDRLLRKVRKRQVLTYVDSSKDAKLLDIGCGRQASLGWDLRRSRIFYYGLDRDIPPGSFQNLHFIKGCAEELPLLVSREKFDYVVILAVIEHISEVEEFLQDVYKVLKSSGKLIITTPPPSSKLILELLSFLRLIDGSEIQEHKQYFDLEALESLLIKKGFSVVKKQRFLFGLNSAIIALRED